MNIFRNAFSKINSNTVTATATVILAIFGILAFFEYQKVNEMATFEELDKMEYRVQDIIMSDDDMNAFWVSISNDNNIINDNNINLILKNKEIATKKINMLVHNAYDNNNKKIIIPLINHVEQIESLLYEESMFNHPAKCKLRKCYTLAETILYLVSSAHHAYCKRMIGKSTFETYAAYIGTCGSNPIFIAALAYGHNNGFIDNKFAKFIRKIYMGDKKLLSVIKSIYPEMEDSEWPNKIGKKN